VLLGAGLLAKKAVEKGLKPHPRVKTSLGPGSIAVTEYLKNAGLLTYLEQLGYYVAGYGCTTCIGNSGPLDSQIEESVNRNDVVAAAVLSGNRNFEARIHQAIRANFLMSPPLVVAFGLAGTVNIDMSRDPIGTGKDGKPVYLRDIWPTQEEVAAVMKYATDPEMFRKVFSAFKRRQPAVGRNPGLGRRHVSVGRSVDVRAAAPLFRGFWHAARARGRCQGRAHPRHLRRLHHDRSHQPRGRHPADLTGRALSAGTRRRRQRLQHLRRAPRQP
jgi:aconitate hydratase